MKRDRANRTRAVCTRVAAGRLAFLMLFPLAILIGQGADILSILFSIMLLL